MVRPGRNRIYNNVALEMNAAKMCVHYIHVPYIWSVLYKPYCSASFTNVKSSLWWGAQTAWWVPNPNAKWWMERSQRCEGHNGAIHSKMHTHIHVDCMCALNASCTEWKVVLQCSFTNVKMHEPHDEFLTWVPNGEWKGHDGVVHNKTSMRPTQVVQNATLHFLCQRKELSLGVVPFHCYSISATYPFVNGLWLHSWVQKVHTCIHTVHIHV